MVLQTLMLSQFVSILKLLENQKINLSFKSLLVTDYSVGSRATSAGHVGINSTANVVRRSRSQTNAGRRNRRALVFIKLVSFKEEQLLFWPTPRGPQWSIGRCS